jgi:FAD/FMN-containing dehydrogenase
MWRAIENFPGPPTAKQGGASCLAMRNVGAFSLFAPPAELGAALQVLEETSDPAVATAAYIGRCGIGHLLIHFEITNSEWDESSQAKAVRQRLPPAVQFLNEWHELPNFASMSAIKRAIDPNRVLLRGRRLF